MNRRDALKNLIVLSGSVSVFGAKALLANDTSQSGGAAAAARFTPALLALIDEVAETIIPETPDSGGAKAAKIGEGMREIVTDYYTAEEREIFFAGTARIAADAAAQYDGRGFLELTPAEREALLLSYENAAETPAGYTMLKQLTTFGYFTSEVGQTEALAYLPVPTRYEGDIPLQPGQKAWAQ